MSFALSLEAKRSGVRKKPLSHAIQVGANSLLFLVIALSILVTFLYLAHANRNATEGYSLKTLQSERSELMIANEVADMTIADITSLKQLERDPLIETMIAADYSIEFVGEQTTVALLPSEE